MASPSATIFTFLKNLPAGKYLRAVRKQMAMGFQEVQDASERIAAEEKNEQFYISVTRLFQIENDLTTPSAFKILTLSAVYGLDFHDLLRRYGIDTDRIPYLWSLLPHPATHPVYPRLSVPREQTPFPLRMEPEFSWETTQIASTAMQMCSELPATLLGKITRRKYLFGYVGLEDRTMSPLLRPGTLVMIDQKQRRVTCGEWRDEFARPIYFVELRGAYRCAWCQLEGGRLTLIPHPLSPVRVETFNYPGDADVVGQLAGIVMRLAPPESPAPGRECPRH